MKRNFGGCILIASKPKPKSDDPDQSKRFLDTAKEIGADEDAGNVAPAELEVL